MQPERNVRRRNCRLQYFPNQYLTRLPRYLRRRGLHLVHVQCAAWPSEGGALCEVTASAKLQALTILSSGHEAISVGTAAAGGAAGDCIGLMLGMGSSP